MSDPYERVKAGRLAFKGGTLATRSKGVDKKRKNKNKKNKDKNPNEDEAAPAIEEEQQGEGEGEGEGEGGGSAPASASASGEPYTIDAAKRMKYEQLFPVEAKKFGYEPKTNFKSVEEALDDRVKKKADRYCK